VLSLPEFSLISYVSYFEIGRALLQIMGTLAMFGPSLACSPLVLVFSCCGPFAASDLEAGRKIRTHRVLGRQHRLGLMIVLDCFPEASCNSGMQFRMGYWHAAA